MSKKTVSRVLLYTVLLAAVIVFMQILGRFKWKDYTNVKESEDFIIYSDTTEEKTQMYYDFLVSFKQHFEDKFFIPGEYRRLKVYIFSDPNKYMQFSKRVRYNTPYGFYLFKERLLVFNEVSGIGTLLHETTHHFNHNSGWEYPKWFDEGLAAFFEKFLAMETSPGTYVFSFGYFNPWRFEETYNILVNSNGSFRDFIGHEKPVQSMARSFLLFMHRKGLLGKAIEKITEGEDNEKILEGIFGKNILEIESEWRDWVEDSRSDADVMLMDSSIVLTEEQIEYWTKGKRAVWDPEKEIYTTHR
ncbi:MAG: hypothetical protein ABH868_06675 [bacterium]